MTDKRNYNKGGLSLAFTLIVVIVFSGVFLFAYSILLNPSVNNCSEYDECFMFTDDVGLQGNAIPFVDVGFNIEDYVSVVSPGILELNDNRKDDSIRFTHSFAVTKTGTILFSIMSTDVEKTTVYTLETLGGTPMLEVKIEGSQIKLTSKDSVDYTTVDVRSNVWYNIKVIFNYDDDYVHEGMREGKMSVSINNVEQMISVNIEGSSIGKFVMKSTDLHDGYKSYLDNYYAVLIL